MSDKLDESLERLLSSGMGRKKLVRALARLLYEYERKERQQMDSARLLSKLRDTK